MENDRLEMKSNIIYNKDCLSGMKEFPDNSIDFLCTDPPYGISFMGKQWDKAIPSLAIWRESLRILKPGAFAFVMCIPRQDCLARMIVSLENAGFNVSFTSMYHCFASGFPKAQNIGKAVDKRNDRHPDNKEFRQYLRKAIQKSKLTQKQITKHLDNYMLGHYIGDSQPTLPTLEHWEKLKDILDLDNRFNELIEREEAEREVIGKSKTGGAKAWIAGFKGGDTSQTLWDVTLPATLQAQALDGSYSYNPKPAVEVILVVQKPMIYKTYVDQALAWYAQKKEVEAGKREGTDIGPGCVNFGECRIPYKNKEPNLREDKGKWAQENVELWGNKLGKRPNPDNQGRFPANLLVSDDVLNDGKISKSLAGRPNKDESHTNTYGWAKGGIYKSGEHYPDSGSFSRYFSLDAWFDKKLKELPEGVRRTFPFLLVSKASKAEKNRGCEGLEEKAKCNIDKMGGAKCTMKTGSGNKRNVMYKNYHPTVKPIKLMSYLITLGSRPGDLILDPFLGSGTTAISAKMLDRQYIGYEINKEYFEIAKARLKAVTTQLSLFKGN